MISSTKKYIAAGIIANFKDLVLLGRRSRNCHNLAGHWSVPCGMIDPGENPETAAKREFFEETGVRVNKQIKFLDDFEVKEAEYFALYSMQIDDLIFPSSDAIDAIEHDEWGFFKIEKKSLPEPMTKETRGCILKLKL
jgi:8-oxo-dGTP pyrophosphatase MutT (NUDIX family)